MIDFHCHLDLYPDPHKVADRVQHEGIGIVSVTTTPSAWPGTKALENGRPCVRTALGLHPELATARRAELDLFETYLADTAFVGEVGLDGAAAQSTRHDQLDVLEHVLTTCSQAGGKILSIHSRRAASPVLEALQRHPDSGVPILHWFSGSMSDLDQAIDLGCWFSVGPAMLAGAKGRALVSKMPRARMVLESDAPFARVKTDPIHPWDLESAAVTLAGIWDIPAQAARTQLEQNERELSSSVADVGSTDRRDLGAHPPSCTDSS
ncbi:MULTISPECIES: Qat anti-phage system TatD family nuclease QatD [Nocardioides]|uniref:TatD family hydrolase n=1 Tax=Nocardioides abyssi TaxID=3058370 RepID=A0ABT8ESY7_9ACTN|nr:MULTISPECIES: Qat anti-phage system TatD family nuclease QatD [Nocardioides]MDF9717008.1 TatD family hydrolase [Nocardioides sp. ChNu-99]MDN4161224.1 TatD family hydrolase [Nocardioides abyssi]MDN7121544.1 TatD family hydrolase [Nocardioides sp. ChNu-153]